MVPVGPKARDGLRQSSPSHITPTETQNGSTSRASRTVPGLSDLASRPSPTRIACERTGRRAFLVEVDALHCDVIVQRWEQLTGGEAEGVPAAMEAVHAEG